MRRLGAVGTLFCLLLLSVPPALIAQDNGLVIDAVEQMDFERPEAWALSFLSSVTALTSLGPVTATEAGSVELGFEVLQVPHLDTRQRTVGFNGQKEEDLNRTPVVGRLRATLGLPADIALTIGWVPPVEVDGARPDLWSLAIARPFWQTEQSSYGWRLHGQRGEVTGSLTCTEGDIANPVGAPGNVFGCEALSDDATSFDYYGLELVGAHRLVRSDRLWLHYGASYQELDLEFQVNARTFGVQDNTLLLADGSTWSLSLGVTAKASERAHVSLEAFWSPLDVVRSKSGPLESDDVFNLRGLLRVKLR